MNLERVCISCLTLFTAPYHIKPHWKTVRDDTCSLVSKLASIILICLDLIPVIGLITAWMTSLYHAHVNKITNNRSDKPEDSRAPQLEWLKCHLFNKKVKWDLFFGKDLNSSSIDGDTQRQMVIRLNGKVFLDRYSNNREDLLNILTSYKADPFCQQHILNGVCNTITKHFASQREDYLVTAVAEGERFIDIQMQNDQIQSIVQWSYCRTRAKAMRGDHKKFFTEPALFYAIIDPIQKKIEIGSALNDRAIKTICSFSKSAKDEVDQYRKDVENLKPIVL